MVRPIEGEVAVDAHDAGLHADHHAEPEAEGDGRVGERERPDRPASVRGDVAATDGSIRGEGACEPRDGEQPESGEADTVGDRVRRQDGTGDRRDQDRGDADATGHPVEAGRPPPDPRGQLHRRRQHGEAAEAHVHVEGDLQPSRPIDVVAGDLLSLPGHVAEARRQVRQWSDRGDRQRGHRQPPPPGPSGERPGRDGATVVRGGGEVDSAHGTSVGIDPSPADPASRCVRCRVVPTLRWAPTPVGTARPASSRRTSTPLRRDPPDRRVGPRTWCRWQSPTR